MNLIHEDPEWKVPSSIQPVTQDRTYFLRPRKKDTILTEVADIDDDDSDYDMSPEPDEDNLVITISQLKKKVQKQQQPSLQTTLPNAVLPDIPFTVTNFDDLFRLATIMKNENRMFKDCQKLTDLYPVLEELNAMIGLKTTKDALCNMILFELQNMQSYYRHMVITGDPGVGKTSIANIIAKIMNRIGRANSDEITHGNPLNMISDYDGQTKSEVNRVVQEALSKSGILLIDEAASLNDVRNKDYYGKKCLDMLMQLMDKYRENLIVILAGYRYDMEVNILQSNVGFRRRIQWFFNMDAYNSDELHQIFEQKLRDSKFEKQENSTFDQKWMAAHHSDFPYFGGSIENFVHKIRTAHTRKTFGQMNKSLLTDETIGEGFELYLKYTIEPMKLEKQKVDLENANQSIVLPPFLMGMSYGRRN